MQGYYLKTDKLCNISDKFITFGLFMGLCRNILMILLSVALSGKFQSVGVGERPRSAVYAIAQDSLGFIWAGTDGGLVRYDGVRSQTFRWEEGNPRSICNEHINVLFYDAPKGTLWVGTNLGLCRYDNAGGFVRDPLVDWRHIKTVFRSGESLWVGTTDGLFRLGEEACGTGADGSASGADAIPAGAGQGNGAQSCAPLSVCVAPGLHIAAGCVLGEDLYFGSYGCLYRVRDDGAEVEKISLNLPGGSQGNLVLALIPAVPAQPSPSSADQPSPSSAGRSQIAQDDSNPLSRSLYIGGEKGLFLFDTASGELRPLLTGVPVKNFLYLPGGGLVAGTDNGLLSLSADGTLLETFRHDLRNSRSIPDNVVWASCIDRDGNLWLGTDHGAAISPLQSDYSFIALDEYIPEGMDVSSLVCTPDGSLWGGGMNGLGRLTRSGDVELFRPDASSPRNRLTHIKVRSLYSDGTSVWIASDGGLDRVRLSGVSHYDITEPSGEYLSDWMYCIAEDSFGRLWTGTYDGGLFVFPKSELPEGGGSLVALRHLSTANGLSGNIVFKLCSAGDRIVAVTDKGVDLIDAKDFSVSRITVPDGARTLSLAGDGDRIWIGTEAGVYLLGSDGELSPLSGSAVSAQSIIYYKEHLFLADETELWRCSLSSGEWALVRNFENPLFSLAVMDDPSSATVAKRDSIVPSGTLFAGSINGCYSLRTDSAPLGANEQKVVISELYLDNVPITPCKAYSGREILTRDIPLTESIRLSSSQNSFALSFTSLKYPLPSGRFAYRLEGFHDQWQISSPDSRAVFLNVPPGRYRFEVHHLGPDGAPDSETAALSIRVLRPWYATSHAILIYLVLLTGLALFVDKFIKVWNALKVERIERAKAEDRATSAVSKAREFRETLSVIFGGRSSSSGGSANGSDSPEGGNSSEGGKDSAPDPDAKFMKEISEIVYRHIEDPEFSAAALCEESRWPSKQVYRKIKQLTGLGPTEFIRDIRLQKAAALLSEGKLSVTEVMYKAGFTTASYFSKCFKARYGKSPSEYREGE